MWCLYPPLNSTYFSPDIFEELEKDISFFNSQGSILLLGDLNARTGKYNDHLEMTDKNYLEIDMFENTENISQRNNCDNILNNHGKIVLQICKSFDLRILNGRRKGDSLGNVTFHGRNGVSTVDYIICDELLFREIDFFIVKPLTTLSDHSQIITWLNIKSTLSFHKGNELDFSTLKKLPTQFIWDKDSANLFNQALISSRTQTLIADYINCEFPVTEKGIDEAVESFESILHSAASQSLKRKIVK